MKLLLDTFVTEILTFIVPGITDIRTIEETATLLKDRAEQDQLSTLEGILLLFASRYFQEDILLEMFGRLFMNTEILEQMPLYQTWMAKSREKGLAEGQISATRKLALLALEGRFTLLAEDMRAAINEADQATLEAIVAHVTTDSLEQVRERLRLGA